MGIEHQPPAWESMSVSMMPRHPYERTGLFITFFFFFFFIILAHIATPCRFFFFFFFSFFLKLYPQMVKDGEHPLLKNSGLGSGIGFPLGRGRGSVPLFSQEGEGLQPLLLLVNTNPDSHSCVTPSYPACNCASTQIFYKHLYSETMFLHG